MKIALLPPDPMHLVTPQLARRWGLSERTLRNWRWRQFGPTSLKIGGRVVYRLADVEAFEASSEQTTLVRP
jgi:hypothetical protein